MVSKRKESQKIRIKIKLNKQNVTIMSREEANKIVDAVCDYFNIEVNKLTLKESNEFYSYVYHSANII